VLPAVLVLLAQGVAVLGGVQGGARPVECGALDGGRASNVWERAKSPELRRYCDLLASGAAKLAGSGPMTHDVLAIADEADHAMPGRAAPGVLRGRALARLGRFPEALAALESARARDERALDEPVALLAWARALAQAGRTKDALDAYRALLPRASLLVTADRGPAYVEAGLLAMGEGPGGLPGAVAIFRQGRREAQDTGRAVAAVALALALDRSGEKAEAKATLAALGAGEARAALEDATLRASLGVGAAPEVFAMLGLTLEGGDAAAARAGRDAWQRYLGSAAGSGPWADHAREHLAERGARRPEVAHAAGAAGGHR